MEDIHVSAAAATVDGKQHIQDPNIVGNVAPQAVSGSKSHHTSTNVEEIHAQTTSQTSSGTDFGVAVAASTSKGKQHNYDPSKVVTKDVSGSENYHTSTKVEDIQVQTTSSGKKSYSVVASAAVSAHGMQHSHAASKTATKDLSACKKHRKCAEMKEIQTQTISQNELYSSGKNSHVATISGNQCHHDQAVSKAFMQDVNADDSNHQHIKVKEIHTQKVKHILSGADSHVSAIFTVNGNKHIVDDKQLLRMMSCFPVARMQVMLILQSMVNSVIMVRL